MKSEHGLTDGSSSSSREVLEQKILTAVREISFGVVEVVVHDRQVTEIRQTRRTRVSPSPTE